MTLDEALQLVAIGGAVKERQLGDAKRLVPEGTTHNVDVWAHITGTISKEVGTPATSGNRPATVQLFDRGVVFAVLERLDVTPVKLRQLLRAAAKAAKPATAFAELAAVFDEVAGEVAAKLPAVNWENPARSGAVRSKVSVEIGEPTGARK